MFYLKYGTCDGNNTLATATPGRNLRIVFHILYPRKKYFKCQDKLDPIKFESHHTAKNHWCKQITVIKIKVSRFLPEFQISPSRPL